jgi:hypothetical protein
MLSAMFLMVILLSFFDEFEDKHLQITLSEVRFQVLTAASMKMAAFCAVALCSPVEDY